jgi:alkanesulfonate monooxygenase SsuD/methylene tetrahydromethanopterin reductase-like flavin-dependent oxidoreductase (luciferase family)
MAGTADGGRMAGHHQVAGYGAELHVVGRSDDAERGHRNLHPRGGIRVTIEVMDAGLHLPQIDLTGEGLTSSRVFESVAAARSNGFVAVSANDHFLFGTPWLDGLSLLAAVVESSGGMTLATTIALAPLRGPVPLAKALTTLQVLSDGRVEAGVGPGSSRRDYDALGVPFDERWPRFDESVALLRSLLHGQLPDADPRLYAVPDSPLRPVAPVPLLIGSWGSQAGLRRVARLGDGWLASAYNTSPARFATARADLQERLALTGRGDAPGCANRLVTMWTWVTEDPEEERQVLHDLLAPLLGRDPDELAAQVCVGPASRCKELVEQYAEAGCMRIHFWPLADEPGQVELLARRVLA